MGKYGPEKLLRYRGWYVRMILWTHKCGIGRQKIAEVGGTDFGGYSRGGYMQKWVCENERAATIL